jgi:endonuclease/exonuclease/phosphatase family metal-dependent hydrolase
LAGDFNITHLNEGYAQMTKRLRDAWWEAGFGFGHTYPVDAQPPGLVAWKYGIPVPQRLIRIDYVFASEEWAIASAQVLPSTGGSDHLGVMVELGLAE